MNPLRSYFLFAYLVIGLLAGCSGTIKQGFVSTDDGTIISLYHSALSSAKVRVAVGSTTLVNLSLKNTQSEVLAPVPAPVVTMSLENSVGTSRGTLGPVTTNSDGTYTAIFTGVSPGSAIFINAFVENEPVINSFPITVISVDDEDFSKTWTFASAEASEYELSDPSSTELVNGLCRLKSKGQADDSESQFASGSGSGVSYGSVSTEVKGLRLSNTGGCNALANNCSVFDSSWTPQWSNLVSYYSFENSWNDVKGSNNGTLSGTVNFSSFSKTGTGSAQFNGAGGYVDLGNPANLHFTSEFSISAWFYVADLSSNRAIVSDWHTGGDSIALLRVTSSGAVQGYINMANGSQNGGTFTFPPVTTLTWMHVMLVARAGHLYMYLNGQESPDSYTYTGINANATNNFFIGRYGGGSFFNGFIDDVAFWQSGLTAGEVRRIYDRQGAKYSGTFTSRVFDSSVWGQSSTAWSKLAWSSTLPFGKELPGQGISESSHDYSSLVGKTAQITDNDLMSGIVGLWHFNEAFGTSGAASIKDSSGHANDGTPSNMTLGANGRFGSAADFNGTNSYIRIPHADIQTLSALTVSVWLYPTATTPGNSGIFQKGTYGGGYSMEFNAGGAGIVKFLTWAGSWTAVSSNVALPMNTWSHVVGWYDGTNLKMYVNGVLQNATASAAMIPSTADFYFGTNLNGSSNYFKGEIDEFALWNRTLNASEIMQLYRRGANRINFQVRACVSNPCNESSEPWLGPDGTNQTYFSELNNNTVAAAMTGNVKATAPAIPYATFTSPPATSRYFQYRAVLESDDPYLRCNYGAGPTPCSPEITSVAVDTPTFTNTNPTVTGLVSANFYSLTSFTETLGSKACDSGVKYQLSLDKIHWYWWNSAAEGGIGSWSESSGVVAEANSAPELQTHFSRFQQMVGAGSVYFKAYLRSSGTSPCELDNVKLEGFN